MRRVSVIDERVERFIIGYWDINVRDYFCAGAARADLHIQGLHNEVCTFLYKPNLSPSEWSELCNVQVSTVEEVHADAAELLRLIIEG